MVAPVTALGALAVAAVVATAASSPFPSGTASAICGAKTIPFQQGALASGKDSLWVACRDGRKLLKINASNGTRSRTVSFSGFHPWAVASGFGALWTIDRYIPAVWRDQSDDRTPHRPDPPLRAPRRDLGGRRLRVDRLRERRPDRPCTPKTARVKLIAAGDGVSGFATDGTHVFAVSHRDERITERERG